ncbi:UPF0098 protein [Alteripontixanthobacter maritimus]|uniref:UPF0098 protein n=1 Tax=Alteripontixanthobacter maritimus TaxID=2161824 RepID=A0A369Q742_9SPHN|nr:YbhB/YbcL family Raf kinase inhibitor-like protein [Alteripontixanthobacter maritimus]RDC60681.1 UPF0098 protein [Alteripontixanthobacter maritimus]
MPETVPDWLQSALHSPHSGHASLTIAKLADQKSFGRGNLALSSPAFRDGEELDPCFTAQEEDAVAPPLEWTAPPPGTQELVIVVEDAGSAAVPTASSDLPCHWLVWGLAPNSRKLLEGETPPRVGKNSQKNSEWLLPDPAAGDGAHHYVFQLFALDLPLVLMPGASRAQLHKAIEGHVISATVLTGTYEHQPDLLDDWDGDADGA